MEDEGGGRRGHGERNQCSFYSLLYLIFNFYSNSENRRGHNGISRQDGVDQEQVCQQDERSRGEMVFFLLHDISLPVLK